MRPFEPLAEPFTIGSKSPNSAEAVLRSYGRFEMQVRPYDDRVGIQVEHNLGKVHRKSKQLTLKDIFGR